MKILLAAWRLLDRRERRRLLGLQLLSILMAFSTVGGMAAVLPFFTALSEPSVITTYPALHQVYAHLGFTNEKSFVLALGLAFVTAVIVSNVVNLLGSHAIDRFAYGVGNALHTDLFADYLYRDYGFHANSNAATLASNVLHETTRITSGILRQGLMLVTSLVSATFILGSIIWVQPLVAVLAVMGLGTGYAAVYVIARARLLDNGTRESNDVEERARIVNESFGAIKELIILRAQSAFVSKVTGCSRTISGTIVSTIAIGQRPKYILECATACVLVGIALHSRDSATAVGPWVGELSFIALAIYRLLPTLQQSFHALVRMRAESAAFAKIGADLQRARASPARRPVLVEPSWRNRPAHGIRLNRVSFHYGAMQPPTLQDIDLAIPAGAIIGFTGTNGCGKTTLVDVLSGLLVPQSGSVEIDGMALDERNRSAWLSAIAYVPQQVTLCEATLAENIALGETTGRVDHARMHAAVRAARLEDYVAALPKGYEARLGGSGVRLSGGQRQRVGIARALYREGSLLIMDEATSSLDIETERDITDAVAAQRGRRTILIVAHRLDALRCCDLIHHLSDGRIIRSGTFQQLYAPKASQGSMPCATTESLS